MINMHFQTFFAYVREASIIVDEENNAANTPSPMTPTQIEMAEQELRAQFPAPLPGGI